MDNKEFKPEKCERWRPDNGGEMIGLKKGMHDATAIRNTKTDICHGILYGGYPDFKKYQDVFLNAPEMHRLIKQLLEHGLRWDGEKLAYTMIYPEAVWDLEKLMKKMEQE